VIQAASPAGESASAAARVCGRVALQVGVTALGVPPPLLPVQERLALGGDRPAGGRDGDHAGQVDAGHHAGVGGGQGDADRRADVLALGAEPLVAESLGHQRGP
jgi:hypothetical protein